MVKACKFPSLCWYARNVQNVVRNNTSNSGLVTLDNTMNRLELELRNRKHIDSEIIKFIDNLPPLTPGFEKTPPGRVLNLVQEVPEPFVKASRIAFHNDILLQAGAKILDL